MAKRFEKAREYTEKYKSMLLPCKWCGNTDVRIMSGRTILTHPKDVWFVSCQTKSCDCTGDYTSVKKAVEAWNANQTTDIAPHNKVLEEIVKQFVSVVDE